MYSAFGSVGTSKRRVPASLSAHPVALLLDDGTLLGYWIVHGTSGYEAGPEHIALTSGIRIPAGSSLKLNPGIDSGRWVYYSLSGYYAQP
jgi:hypothetical protein